LDEIRAQVEAEEAAAAAQAEQNEEEDLARAAAEAASADPKVCSDCEQPSEVFCHECLDAFCLMCYRTNHRTGRRKLHVFTHITNLSAVELKKLLENPPTETIRMSGDVEHKIESSEGGQVDNDFVLSGPSTKVLSVAKVEALAADTGALPEWWGGKKLPVDWFVERSKYIPLRLTHEERRFLRMLQGVLKASGYTDKVDQPPGAFKNAAAKRVTAMQELVGVLTALVYCTSIHHGKQVMEYGTFAKNAAFFQHVFELGRRHKIRNPEKMRSSYGALLYLLQDAQSPEALNLLGFSCVRPVITVYDLLSEKGGLEVLRDPLLPIATQEIVTAGKTREEINEISRRKYEAFKRLVARHQSPTLSKETISLAVYSIGDNHNFLRCNRDPCNEMIKYLTTFFHPTEAKSEEYSLAITEGVDGARLTHSHAAQYHYVLQSLCLWRDILDDFFRLWYVAEQDLLNVAEHPYTLSETGQGMQRLQPAPNVDKIMRQIVYNVQKKAGTWVGSSVIHLGDRNVPNALLFIDKYNQVGRILQPICICLRELTRLEDSYRPKYIDLVYGSVEAAQRVILRDFFRYAFDGSGSDNFFEAGSCIDGRLTSAWHWCNQLPAKPFFPLFQITNFVGFDGTDWDT